MTGATNAADAKGGRSGAAAFAPKAHAACKSAAAAPSGPQPAHPQSKGNPYRRGMPLWLVVARYFVYSIVSIAALGLLLIGAFGVLLNMALIYPANYGANHSDSTLEAVQRQERFDADAIPSAYWYAHLNADGSVIETDMDQNDLAAAQGLVRSGGDSGVADPASDYDLYTAVSACRLGDGTWCAIGWDLTPQFTTRELRDALPNPQNALLAFALAGSIAVLLGFAVRASRVITRKMQPLVNAAQAIGRQDLDFTVGTSNVRQINDVLASMESMRAQLASSLEARWRAEEAQRAQVAALAHDLKTPLTVIEANADYLAEDDRLAADARDAAQAVADGARRLNGAVQAVIEAARGHVATPQLERIDVRAFADDIAHEAAAFAHAAGVAAKSHADIPGGCAMRADRSQLERAFMNLVTNAVEHSPQGGTVRIRLAVEAPPENATPPGKASGEKAARGRMRPHAVLVFSVEDDGAGFTPAALAHGCERFFRDDAARGPAADGRASFRGAHFGIGLSTAADVARSHGGTLALANREDEDGRVMGARAIVRLPLEPHN